MRAQPERGQRESWRPHQIEPIEPRQMRRRAVILRQGSHKTRMHITSRSSVDTMADNRCCRHSNAGEFTTTRQPCQNSASATEPSLSHFSSKEVSVDINKQVAALTASELQTAGASQATAIAVSVLLRQLRSPELAKLLSSAFENHQAVMLQTPWPDQMLQAFESTRRFLEGAAQAELPGSRAQSETPGV